MNGFEGEGASGSGGLMGRLVRFFYGEFDSKIIITNSPKDILDFLNLDKFRQTYEYK